MSVFISKRNTKRALYHETNGFSVKLCHYEIPRGIFYTNFGNSYGHEFSTHFSKLEEELDIMCKKQNIRWPKMFNLFIDDGFGGIKSNNKEFSLWVNEFNCLYEPLYF